MPIGVWIFLYVIIGIIYTIMRYTIYLKFNDDVTADDIHIIVVLITIVVYPIDLIWWVLQVFAAILIELIRMLGGKK